ncbi:hypothetical protein LIPSTDRAFT_232275 [Lipomyces starkeyi NRRL Y-11557]|uniref:Uncharacterized protein n=1 Tax=Lipomyces starkeyi NRRL Y-11557 TaxID=675824 RepID=A0A1E3QB38_LIPST|nr:hypothetical protein LIPSTDRAFT_232275 [Lipomyces starkeyi NRRL Y-11557]
MLSGKNMHLLQFCYHRIILAGQCLKSMPISTVETISLGFSILVIVFFVYRSKSIVNMDYLT